MADEAPSPQMEQYIEVDGVEVDMEDFSFREQREVRRLVYEEIALERDREKPWEEQMFNDIYPAIVCVYMRRQNGGYTLDQALDMKARDVIKERPVAPPTKRANAKHSAAKR